MIRLGQCNKLSLIMAKSPKNGVNTRKTGQATWSVSPRLLPSMNPRSGRFLQRPERWSYEESKSG